MTTATTTHTPKWEDLPIDNIVENYIRLKQNERERNKRMSLLDRTFFFSFLKNIRSKSLTMQQGNSR